MRVAHLSGPRTFAIAEESMPELRSRDVLIRVRTCGVCTGEIESWAEEGKRYPVRMGHEVAGEIAAVGAEVTEVKPGDLVSAINDSAGFAEFCRTPVERVALLPPQVPVDVAIGEPLACAVNAARRTRADYHDTIVLVGSGFMGLLLMQCLLARSPKRLIAIDTREEALERAPRYGADMTLNAAAPDVKDAVMDLTGGKGADIVIEASGTQPGLTLCGELVRIRGHLVIYGYHKSGLRQVNMQQWNWKGLDVTNAHERDPMVYVAGMRAGLDLVAQGRVKLAELVTHRFPLEQINEAFSLAHAKPPEYVKATVDMDWR